MLRAVEETTESKELDVIDSEFNDEGIVGDVAIDEDDELVDEDIVGNVVVDENDELVDKDVVGDIVVVWDAELDVIVEKLDDVVVGPEVVGEELDVTVEELEVIVEGPDVVGKELDVVVEGLEVVGEELELCCVDEGPMDNSADELLMIDELS